MRTSLRLDEDVAAAIEKLRKDRKMSLEEIINEALRLGLRQMESKSVKRKVFRTRAVSLGRCRIGSIDNVDEALVVADRETFK
ncbi:MAG: CopG family transcriptional regulator [Blastocatellales bacterium]